MRCHIYLLILIKQIKTIMPKVKTNSGAKKRFTLTGTGKVKRHHAYHSHILTKKTKKQKRNLDHSAIVVTENMKQVRDLLCLR
jgi:large subunit ribosomal protein L35